MRFMVIVKATKDSEAGVMPSEQLLTEMGNFNEELVKAGVMLAGDGLQPSSKGARVRFSGDKRTVIDGPFAETKELVAGYLDLEVQVARRRRSSGSRSARIRIQATNPRSRFARCSRWKISAPSSRRSFASKKQQLMKQAADEREEVMQL